MPSHPATRKDWVAWLASFPWPAYARSRSLRHCFPPVLNRAVLRSRGLDGELGARSRGRHGAGSASTGSGVRLPARGQQGAPLIPTAARVGGGWGLPGPTWSGPARPCMATGTPASPGQPPARRWELPGVFPQSVSRWVCHGPANAERAATSPVAPLPPVSAGAENRGRPCAGEAAAAGRQKAAVCPPLRQREVRGRSLSSAVCCPDRSPASLPASLRRGAPRSRPSCYER